MCNRSLLLNKSPKCKLGYLVENEMVSIRKSFRNELEMLNLEFVDQSQYICRKKDYEIYCPYLVEGKNVFVDNNHLSRKSSIEFMLNILK